MNAGAKLALIASGAVTGLFTLSMTAGALLSDGRVAAAHPAAPDAVVATVVSKNITKPGSPREVCLTWRDGRTTCWQASSFWYATHQTGDSLTTDDLTGLTGEHQPGRS